jgi:hypothetical protein
VADRFRIVPLAMATAAGVRATLRTPGWGYPASVEVATGYGPCRTCLRMFAIGVERRIFFTHDEFADREPYPLPGPVYIHQEACEAYVETGVFPEALRPLALTFNGYATGRELRGQVRVQNGDAEAAIVGLFSDPAVAYIHVRNTEVGCFLLGVDRP